MKIEDLKYLRAVYSTCSKKDLNACTPILYKKLSSVGLEKTITHFQDLRDNFTYIPYTKHLKGLSHHCNLGPSRRPIKCYKYIIEVLKNLRGELNLIESHKLNHVIINTSSKGPKGARKCGRGRRYPEDSLKHRLLFVLGEPLNTNK